MELYLERNFIANFSNACELKVPYLFTASDNFRVPLIPRLSIYTARRPIKPVDRGATAFVFEDSLLQDKVSQLPLPNASDRFPSGA